MRARGNGPLSRRGFLGGVAALGAGSLLVAGEEPKKDAGRKEAVKKAVQVPGMLRGGRKYGLQLYSVREECAKDLAKVIAAVAQMGYQGVEFAGYHGKTAAELRALLDQHKLKCCGTHTGWDTLSDANLQATIEFNKTIGNKYLIVPGLPGECTKSRQAWLDTAKRFNELAEKLKPLGMFVGYHNHSAEFQPLEGVVPWDLFMQNTSKDVVMQLDTGNCMSGGGEPLPYLYKYEGRARTVHVKEFSKANPKALIGEGDVPWKAFFALCRAVGNVDWYIVEYESDAYPSLEAVDRCLKNLKAMRF